jgi:hypothetical protein
MRRRALLAAVCISLVTDASAISEPAQGRIVKVGLVGVVAVPLLLLSTPLAPPPMGVPLAPDAATYSAEPASAWAEQVALERVAMPRSESVTEVNVAPPIPADELDGQAEGRRFHFDVPLTHDLKLELLRGVRAIVFDPDQAALPDPLRPQAYALRRFYEEWLASVDGQDLTNLKTRRGAQARMRGELATYGVTKFVTALMTRHGLDALGFTDPVKAKTALKSAVEELEQREALNGGVRVDNYGLDYADPEVAAKLSIYSDRQDRTLQVTFWTEHGDAMNLEFQLVISPKGGGFLTAHTSEDSPIIAYDRQSRALAFLGSWLERQRPLIETALVRELSILALHRSWDPLFKAVDEELRWARGALVQAENGAVWNDQLIESLQRELSLKRAQARLVESQRALAHEESAKTEARQISDYFFRRVSGSVLLPIQPPKILR